MKNLRDYEIIVLNNDENAEKIFRNIPGNKKHKTLLQISDNLWNYDNELVGHIKDFERYFLIFGKSRDAIFNFPITTNYGRFPSNELIKQHVFDDFDESDVIVQNIIELKSHEDLLDYQDLNY